MKKIIFGIFAHPDDEAFGPAGTLLQEARAGAELHLVTLTNGDAGTNPDGHDSLGTRRLEEWHRAGELLGAAHMEHWGYKDGMLNNTTMIEITKQLVTYVQAALKTTPKDSEVEFITFDLNGLTGHIDHIVTSRAACLAFYQLKAHDKRLKRVRLYCLSQTQQPSPSTAWLYMEQGHRQNEISETVDARAYHNELLTIVQVHRSQRNDGKLHIQSRGSDLGLNHFIVLD